MYALTIEPLVKACCEKHRSANSWLMVAKREESMVNQPSKRVEGFGFS